MADHRGTAAYDLSLFEPKQPKVVALPQNKKVQRAQKRRTRLQKIVNAVVATVCGGAVLTVVTLMIVSRVRLTEMNESITGLNEQLSILQSETIRLNNELASKTSTESVENYAAENGMQKAESYQVGYFTVDGGERIEVPTEEEPGLWQSLVAWIGGLFD